MRPVRQPAARRASSCTTGLLPQIGEDARQLGFEGRLDCDFQIIMSVASHVHRYVEQPETFVMAGPDRLYRYTPDGLAFTTVGNIYFEVKPKRKLALSPDLDGRLEMIRAACAKRKGRFQIVTEDHIRHGFLLENSIAVWSAAQGMDAAEIRRACQALRLITLPPTFGEIAEFLGPRGAFLTRGMIGHRYLAADLVSALLPGTRVTRGLRDW